MDNLLESLVDRRVEIQRQIDGVFEERDAAKSKYENLCKESRALEYRLRELSVAINALEKSAKGPEEGVVGGNGYTSPFRRQRRNVREMIRSALEHADHPMTEKELMREVEATKISVNSALTHLMVHGQVTTIDGGWTLKSKAKEYRDDDDEDEVEATLDLRNNQDDERKHMYE